MTCVRALLMRSRGLTLLMVVAALCMKLLVPGGYMIASDSPSFSVRICTGTLERAAVREVALPMTGERQTPLGKQVMADTLCPYSALSLGTLSAADPALLILALAFVLLLGLAPVTVPALRQGHHLRPPLRGPPALA